MTRLVQALPGDGRLVVWVGRQLGSGLVETCAVEEEISLPNSQHRRILCLRPLRRG